jgi:DNA-binding Xre family transcriptional regulator
VSYLEKQNNGVDDSGLGVVVDFVRKAKKVRRDIVEKMCEKHGVKIDDVLKVFKEVDGYVVA